MLEKRLDIQKENLRHCVLVRGNPSISGDIAMLKQEKPQFSLKLLIKVENIGVEPMTSCMPCKRSSQLS
jgi:hypothetical protein